MGCRFWRLGHGQALELLARGWDRIRACRADRGFAGHGEGCVDGAGRRFRREWPGAAIFLVFLVIFLGTIGLVELYWEIRGYFCRYSAGEDGQCHALCRSQGGVPARRSGFALRILQIHNFYRQAGGEDAVLAAEARLLREHCHEVDLFSAENHQLVGTKEKLIAAWRVVYSDRVRLELRAHLQSFCPDVVHVHNFFPLLTPSVYDACIEKNIPVVQTLHNYRIICPNALFLRNGKVCEDCLGRGPFPAVVHACYRGSRLATLPVALMVAVHRHRRTWKRKVDRIIALSALAKNKFLEGGLPAEKIVVKPNFAPDPDVRGDFIRRKNALFVGRLGEEKGISVLIKAWKELDHPLRIVGDGPFTGRAREVLNPAISWRVRIPRRGFFGNGASCLSGFTICLR